MSVRIGPTKMQNSLSIHQPQAGFSLIELMITLTILAILLFMGQALTRAWIDRAHVNETMNVLQTALSMTKSSALRNSYNQPQQYPAASLCYDPATSVLSVVRAKANTTQACQNTQQTEILRQFKISKGVTVQVNQNHFDCVAFNSSGLFVHAVGQFGNCHHATPLNILIEKHNERVELTLQ